MRTMKSLLAACAALLFGVAAFAAAPAKPANVAATLDDTEGIRLTWDAVSNAAYYIVYRYGGKTAQTDLVQTRVTEPTCFDTSCEAGVEIPYRVRAFDKSGAGSAYSAYMRGYRKVLLEPNLGGECSVNPLANAGVAQPLKVRSNYRWQASADDWIHLHNAAFERSNEATNLAFSLTRNDTGAPRTGTITLKAGHETATLKVVQGAVEVADYPSWCGDSQQAILEDAAFPETFKFMTPWPVSFVTVPDDTAVGGSCLRSMPVTTGQCAVVAWSLPNGWRLRFSWRKDTDNPCDRLTLRTGNLVNGKPELFRTTTLATCDSTEWTTVELDQGSATTNLFFVYEKTAGGTASTTEGFAFLDNFLLQTAPKSIRFLDPPVKYDLDADAYSLLLPTVSGSRTVATEVTFSHSVTLGGETRPATGIVIPDWAALEDSWYLFIQRGTGADENLTTFSYSGTGVGSIDVRASYTVGTATASQILTINYEPSALNGLDAAYNGAHLTEGSVPCEWHYVADDSAFQNSAAESGALTRSGVRSMSAKFSGNQLIRFSYKVASLAADESFTVSVDGLEIPADFVVDGNWNDLRIYVPTDGEHEIVWTFAKTGRETPGGGVRIDNVDFETPRSYKTGANMLMTSAVFDNAANSFLIHVAVPTNEFSLATMIGEDWIDTSAWDGSRSVIAFDIPANETGAFRSGRIRAVSGSVTNYIRVVQSATDSAEVEGLAIETPYGVDLAAGDEIAFFAYFTLGGVSTYTDELDFYCENELLEDGVLVAPDVDDVVDVDIMVELGAGSYRTYGRVFLHPSPAALIPDNATLLEVNGWWVEKDDETGELFLQTDLFGNVGTRKVLSMSVTGPCLFTCQGYQKSAGFYLDGQRVGGSLGSIGSWGDGYPVEVPAGEHTLLIEYEKTETTGTYRDFAAIRRLALTPVTYAGASIEGATTIFGGGRNGYALVKHYTNETAHVGWDERMEHDDWSTECTVTGIDPRTAEIVKTEFSNGRVFLNVPMSMSWNDTITLTLTADDDGTPCTASIDVAVTPTDLGEVLDNNLPGFSIPYKSSPYVSASIAEDAEATGGSCLELRSDRLYETSDLELQIMDEGILTFNYKLDREAELTVSVDGEETRSLGSTTDWTSVQIEVKGYGPHRILWAVVTKRRESIGSIDNVQWTPGAGGRVTGAEVYLDEDYGYSQIYKFRIIETIPDGRNTKTETFDLAPDSWNLTFVSGDEEAAWENAMSDTCWIYPLETIQTKTTYRLSASCTFAGTTYVGEKLIEFEPRVSVEDAIFDSGRAETLSYSWADGWSGTFEDHSVGTSCAKSDTAARGETRSIYVNIFGKGTLEFDCKFTGGNVNKLAFCERMWDDKAGEERIVTRAAVTSMTRDWQHVTITFGDDEEFDANGRPMNHDCYWEYTQQGDNASGTDFAWIDNVKWSGATPLPIEYGVVTVTPDTLAPGESATASIAFYRQGKNDGRDPEPATGSDVPRVTGWSVIDCEPSQLSGYVKVAVDRTTGNAVVSVDPNCPYEGYCYLLPSYSLYGEKNEWNSGYLCVTKSASKSSAAPRAMSTLTQATLSAPAMQTMAANGVNTVGECLVAGMDPDDAEAKFTVSVTMKNGVPYITWSPNLPDRTYVIKGKASLGDPEWVAPTNSTHRFFKVEIIDTNK